MDFENYSKRINLVRDNENFGQLLPDKQKQNRFTVTKNSVYLEDTIKSICRNL